MKNLKNIYDFIEYMVNSPVPEESDFVFKSVKVLYGSKIFELTVKKKKRTKIIEGVPTPMIVTVDLPDSNISMVFKSFMKIFKSDIGQTSSIVIVKSGKEYILSFQITPVMEDELFFTVFTEEKDSKLNRYIFRTVEFIRKSPSGVRTKSEITVLNKNLQKEIREKVLQYIESSPEIIVEKESGNDAKKIITVYKYNKQQADD